MYKFYCSSPLITSSVFSQLLNCSVYLKIEVLQPSGSFKIRGIGNLCQHHANNTKTKGFVSSSGGNAGIAVAYAGRMLKKPVKVVIPETTPLLIREKIQAEGAEVIIEGKIWDEADKKAKALCKKSNFTYIHPFDDPHIWDGHASIVDELAKLSIKFDAMVLSVGGGGLFCGVAQGCHQQKWSHIEFITSETHGAASFAKSLDAGKLITLKTIDTIALTLGAKQVAPKTLEWAKKFPVHTQLVSDKAAVNACIRFADDHRLLVEPACGATLALLYENRDIFKRYQSICVIVCGGNGISRALLNQWEQDYHITPDAL